MRIAGIALLVLAASALPAHANHAGGGSDRSKLVLGDPAGDANFVNDGGEHGNGNRSTPVSEPSLDIRRVEVAPIGRGDNRTGFTVKITTEGDLRDRTRLTFATRTKNCADIYLRYVHGSGDPVAQIGSGCSSGVVPLTARVESNRVTLVVPFSALPVRARQDDVLTRANVFSQVHVVREPVTGRWLATNMVDTTLQNVTYRMR